jgi:hypothetical protein
MLSSAVYFAGLWSVIVGLGADTPLTGDAVIRRPAGPSEIVITTTSRTAGAIHSLTWGGREFIDSADHGRQLQSAAAFGDAKDFWAEAFNPTEAGARRDGAGPRSSSRLLRLQAHDNQLTTTTQMAFWLAPGEKSGRHPARNLTGLSDVRLTKRVVIGYKQFPHAIDYRVTFAVPPAARHTFAQFEALTGYMPPDFTKFWALDPKTAQLRPLSDGPGEQSLPVVFGTANDLYAMGVWSPNQPAKGYESLGYGRFRFRAEKVVKWNCVFRVKNAMGVRPGNYDYRVFVAVGSLQNVRDTLTGLMKEFRERE